MAHARLFLALCFIAAFGSNTAAQNSSRYNCLQYGCAKDGGANLKRWWKWEGTIGVTNTGPVTYTHGSRFETMPSHIAWAPYDSVRSGTAVPASQVPGVNAALSKDHLLVRLSRSSMISFSAGVDVKVMQYSFEGFFAGLRATRVRPLMVGQVGIPLTVEYKWGCDVDFDPRVGGCFAVGGGAIPTFSQAYYGDVSDRTVRVAPYLYASAGFYAAGCWKIRASYIPGAFPIMTSAAKMHDGTTVNTLDVQGRAIMTVGLSRMLRSGDWRRAHAWRSETGGGKVARLF